MVKRIKKIGKRKIIREKEGEDKMINSFVQPLCFCYSYLSLSPFKIYLFIYFFLYISSSLLLFIYLFFFFFFDCCMMIRLQRFLYYFLLICFFTFIAISFLPQLNNTQKSILKQKQQSPTPLPKKKVVVLDGQEKYLSWFPHR